MHNPLSRLARDIFDTPDRRQALLAALWEKVVGPEVARRSRVVGLEDERLRVRLAEGTWRRIVGRMRGEILLRLREAAGPLAPRGLIFVEGSIEEMAPPPPLTVRAARPAETPLPESLVEAASAIADPEIRDRFRETAALYLGRSHAANGMPRP
jgi:hypothetical protein